VPLEEPVSGADDAVEAFFLRGWAWCRKHWMVACLAPWVGLAWARLLDGDLLAAAVHLAVATAIFYGMAKVEAIDRAEKAEHNSKG
jgi:hypothetical protein